MILLNPPKIWMVGEKFMRVGTADGCDNGDAESGVAAGCADFAAGEKPEAEKPDGILSNPPKPISGICVLLTL